MLHVSHFTPDASRHGEWIACLWQGPLPASLQLHRWIYLDTEPRSMTLVWEGDDDARAYMERAFGGFGVLGTETATDATPGLAACFDRDLDAFGRWLDARGTAADEAARQLDLRRRGKEAATWDDAIAAGRAWASEQQAR
jgi:hypothetical protein